MNHSYEMGLRHGRIETEAYLHFDVLYSGIVSTERLHQWVKDEYDETTAIMIFPLPEHEECEADE